MGYILYTVNEDYDKLETGTKAKSINDQSIYSPISVRKVSEFAVTVEFDAAHNNFHTASGRYRPFAELLHADGLSVRSNQAPFAANSFRGVDLVVSEDGGSAEPGRGRKRGRRRS